MPLLSLFTTSSSLTTPIAAHTAASFAFWSPCSTRTLGFGGVPSKTIWPLIVPQPVAAVVGVSLLSVEVLGLLGVPSVTAGVFVPPPPPVPPPVPAPPPPPPPPPPHPLNPHVTKIVKTANANL